MKENVFSQWVERYQPDPVLFVQEVLGVDPDKWQIEFLNRAIAAAERADLRGAMCNLDDALAQAATMRPDLEDLVLEVERKMDEGP